MCLRAALNARGGAPWLGDRCLRLLLYLRRPFPRVLQLVARADPRRVDPFTVRPRHRLMHLDMQRQSRALRRGGHDHLVDVVKVDGDVAGESNSLSITVEFFLSTVCFRGELFKILTL